MSQLQLAWWLQQKLQGDDAFRAGNYQDAVTSYSNSLRTKAMQGDPEECARVHCNRCLAFQYSQQWNYAVEDALLAIQLQPNWWKGWYRLGSALLGCNRFAEAVYAFEQTIKLNRKNTELRRRFEFAKLQAERCKEQDHRLQPKPISYNVVDFINQHAPLIEAEPEDEVVEEVRPPTMDDLTSASREATPNGYAGYPNAAGEQGMPPGYHYHAGMPPGGPYPPGMQGEYGGMPTHKRSWSGNFAPYGPPPGGVPPGVPGYGPPGGYGPGPDHMRQPSAEMREREEYYASAYMTQANYTYVPPPPPNPYPYGPPPGVRTKSDAVPLRQNSGTMPAQQQSTSPTSHRRVPSNRDVPPEVAAEEQRTAGNNFYTEGRYEEAYAAYCKATDLNPRMAPYYANRAAAAMMLKRYRAAVDDCLKAIELDHMYIRGYSRAAKAYCCLGNFDKALNLLTVALQKDPTNSDLEKERLMADKARDAMKKARESMALGRGRMALEFAQLCLDSVSLNVEPALHLKAEALMAMGRYEEAVDAAREITIAGESGHYEAVTMRGRAQYCAGNLEAAAQLLEEAAQLAPAAHMGLASDLLKKTKVLLSSKAAGNVAFKDGQWKEAVEHYSKALEADPELRTTFVAQCACNRATALLKLGRNEEAVKDCNFALFVDASFIKAYLRRASAYQNLKQFDAAIKDLEQVRELEPDMPDISKMIKEVKTAMRKARRDVDYYEVLGVAEDVVEVDIKKAYKKLALRFHPDKVKREEEREHSERMFKLIGEAQSVLTDPEKRSKYDAGWTLEEIENAEEAEMSVDELFAHMYGSDYFRGQGDRDFEDFVKEFSKAEFREQPYPRAGSGGGGGGMPHGGGGMPHGGGGMQHGGGGMPYGGGGMPQGAGSFPRNGSRSNGF